MPLKWEAPEGVYGVVLRDPSDTARAKLHEAQFPSDAIPRLPTTTPVERDRRHTAKYLKSPEPSGRRTAGNELAQGNGRDAYAALERRILRESGIAYGA
jgi:hypothetical protein